MWYYDILWGFWNGSTAWAVLILHAFGLFHEWPVWNSGRDGTWYAFGFLVGLGVHVRSLVKRR